MNGSKDHLMYEDVKEILYKIGMAGQIRAFSFSLIKALEFNSKLEF